MFIINLLNDAIAVPSCAKMAKSMKIAPAILELGPPDAYPIENMSRPTKYTARKLMAYQIQGV